MKNYLVLFLCVPSFLSLFAQHHLDSQLNMYRSGDEIIKQQVSYKDPGRSGENVLWDFSNLQVQNEKYKLIYNSNIDGVITGNEHLTYYHYVLRGDSLLLTGFNNQTTNMKNYQPEVIMEFPVLYKDKKQSYFYGKGSYGARLEMNVMGSVQVESDAYGMIILPNKDTLKNVLRTHTIKYIAEESRPISSKFSQNTEPPLFVSSDSINTRLETDSVLFVVETFRWYERGYRYPVFETVRSWEQHREREIQEFLHTAFFYPPHEHFYLEDDEANLALQDEKEEEGSSSQTDPWEGLSYNIFPNPVRTQPLEIEIYLPQQADVNIQLRNTMGILQIEEHLGWHPEGTCRFTLNPGRLPVGNYILEIRLNEKLISEIVMKR